MTPNMIRSGLAIILGSRRRGTSSMRQRPVTRFVDPAQVDRRIGESMPRSVGRLLRRMLAMLPSGSARRAIGRYLRARIS